MAQLLSYLGTRHVAVRRTVYPRDDGLSRRSSRGNQRERASPKRPEVWLTMRCSCHGCRAAGLDSPPAHAVGGRLRRSPGARTVVAAALRELGQHALARRVRASARSWGAVAHLDQQLAADIEAVAGSPVEADTWAAALA